MDAAIAQAVRTLDPPRMSVVKLILASSIFLTQFAGAAERYWYNFSFDLTSDDQHAEALDYQYRRGKEVLVGMGRAYVQAGRTFMVTSDGGNLPPGTALYFKWRDTQTGKIYEETANFEGRLRGDLEHCAVTLLVIDNHLHVFLVRRHEVRPANMPAIGPRGFNSLKVYEIYPGNSNAGLR
jgi:hypothetical protein